MRHTRGGGWSFAQRVTKVRRRAKKRRLRADRTAAFGRPWAPRLRVCFGGDRRNQGTSADRRENSDDSRSAMILSPGRREHSSFRRR